VFALFYIFFGFGIVAYLINNISQRFTQRLETGLQVAVDDKIQEATDKSAHLELSHVKSGAESKDEPKIII